MEKRVSGKTAAQVFCDRLGAAARPRSLPGPLPPIPCCPGHAPSAELAAASSRGRRSDSHSAGVVKPRPAWVTAVVSLEPRRSVTCIERRCQILVLSAFDLACGSIGGIAQEQVFDWDFPGEPSSSAVHPIAVAAAERPGRTLLSEQTGCPPLHPRPVQDGTRFLNQAVQGHVIRSPHGCSQRGVGFQPREFARQHQSLCRTARNKAVLQRQVGIAAGIVRIRPDCQLKHFFLFVDDHRWRYRSGHQCRNVRVRLPGPADQKLCAQPRPLDLLPQVIVNCRHARISHGKIGVQFHRPLIRGRDSASPPPLRI